MREGCRGQAYDDHRLSIGPEAYGLNVFGLGRHLSFLAQHGVGVNWR